jgi:hypothetical protein
MPIYFSKKVGDAVVCGCARCSSAATLSLTFSGVSAFPDCAPDVTNSSWLTNTAISLSGSYTVSFVIASVWTAAISNGYTYDLYSDVDCTIISDPGLLADLDISLTCSEVDGYSVQVTALTGFPYAFDADGPVIFAASLADIGDSASNSKGAGGFVTLSA